jgi:hypothetical protein
MGGQLPTAVDRHTQKPTVTTTNTTTDTTMNMSITDRLDGSYTSLGDGIEEFVAAHPSLAASPGRTAGFVLGAVAAQLSNWQRWRGLSRTFVQNRDVDGLTFERLGSWQTDIWQKAKVYNAQEGNYGVPWTDPRTPLHTAGLDGENDGWQATLAELRYHYILGVNVGPNISQRARENREASDAEGEVPAGVGDSAATGAVAADDPVPADESGDRQSPEIHEEGRHDA